MKQIKYDNVNLFIKERYFHKNLTDRFEKNKYEKEESDIIKKYYNINDIVLEIGSCLGYTTNLLSNRCYKIISIEANPELIDGLLLMKESNKMNNVRFINAYISGKKNQIIFKTYDNIVAGSGDREDDSINNVRGWGHTLKEYKVNCIQLKSIEGIEEINAMVVDCEGGELEFIRENMELIKNNISKITIELHQHLMKDTKFNQKCLNLLKQINFEVKEKIGNTYYLTK